MLSMRIFSVIYNSAAPLSSMGQFYKLSGSPRSNG
jgi:hypothetical protein